MNTVAVQQSEADAIIGKIETAYSAIEYAEAESPLLAEAASDLEKALQKAHDYRASIK